MALSVLAESGNWHDLNENQKQFRCTDGGILNWYPSTGTINFQGRAQVKAALEKTASSAISDKPQFPSGSSEPITTVKESGTPPVETDSVAAATETTTKSTTDCKHETPLDHQYLGQRFSDSELVIGLVGAVGTELKQVVDILKDRLSVFGYQSEMVRVSADIIPQLVGSSKTESPDEYSRISELMDSGDRAREETGDTSVLALGVAAKISSGRPTEENHPKPQSRRAYIINSLKHPDEVTRLREIYPEGFYLIGVHSDEKRRHGYLTENKRMSADQAESLIRRDEDEHLPHGQRTSDTFHLSDFFVRIDENQDKLTNSLWRILDVLFGHPYVTPTFDEYAMFMAFSASLRSADLSRQVGAVVARNNEIISTGANDCPRYGGGLYWPQYDKDNHEISDTEDGRDYMRGEDANKVEQQKIIEDIVEKIGNDVDNADKLRASLQASRIVDITEYGRMVHAEMEALLSCARSNNSARDAILFCTTFPCHNCAKHIVAAGIVRVVYIEPYPKSKAAEFHSDSISLGFSEQKSTVRFEPFVGVGPRRFFDLFSMRLGSGYRLKRKDAEGLTLDWKPEGSKLRIQMLPCSYVELELIASSIFNQFRKQHSGRE